MHRQAFHLQPLSEADGVRQGDLLRVSDDAAAPNSSAVRWCIVLTADCDIAHSKMGSAYTVVPVMTADVWLNTVWVPDRVRQELKRALQNLAKTINEIDRKRDPSVTTLSSDRLLEWLEQSDDESMCRALATAETKQDAELRKQLAVVRSILRLQGDRTGVVGLRDLRKNSGRSASAFESEIRDAFSSMRRDFLFLPELPEESELGFVALLRDLAAIPTGNVFTRKLDLRANHDPSKGTRYLRVGRLADFLRFAIAQQVAVLFSRIGMPASFEQDCEIAQLSVAERLLSDV